MQWVEFKTLGLWLSVPAGWIVRDVFLDSFAVHPAEYTSLSPEFLPVHRYLAGRPAHGGLANWAEGLMGRRVRQGEPSRMRAVVRRSEEHTSELQSQSN